MSKKQVTSGTKAKKTIVNIIIHIFLAILSFIWVLPIFWVNASFNLFSFNS